MPGPRHEALESSHVPGPEDSRGTGTRSRRPGLYEIALRQAIATQHALARADRLDLRECESCGKPYLLASVWQPLSDEGAVVCPRCGAEAIAWDGARGYVAYWQREAEPRERAGGARRGYR